MIAYVLRLLIELPKDSMHNIGNAGTYTKPLCVDRQAIFSANFTIPSTR